VGAFGERELAMQTIYRKPRCCTTAPLGSRKPMILGRQSILAIAALSVAMATVPQTGLAQTLPTGMVDDPCLPPLADLSPTATEAEITSRREAMIERRRADWGGLCRHRVVNNALGTQPVEAVFIGDSITEFWEAASPDLFRDGVVNRGIGAQTSPQMLLRFQQDVIALKPRVVHIMAGTNDVAGNSGPSRPEDFKNNIRSMVELAQVHGIGVVIGAIPPAATFSWRPGMAPAGRIRELNDWLRDYAHERGAVFVDYHEAMRGADGEMRPELTADGVHPDADGYALMTPLARAAIQAVNSGDPTRR
jgi:lysophospholipase L1-like esterase